MCASCRTCQGRRFGNAPPATVDCLGIAAAGYWAIATDLYLQDGSEPCDFLANEPPARGAIAVTNPPYNQTDDFLAHGRALRHTGRIAGMVLLLRHDHLTVGRRAAILNRAIREVHCNWQPIRIADSDGSPRWSFLWLVWHDVARQPPLYLEESDVALDLQKTPQRAVA